jgi:DNA-binding Xre family transcriptional regulator
MKKIKCRLAELMIERNVTAGELATASGLPKARIDAYRMNNTDAVSLREMGLIASVLRCANISELFEIVPDADTSGSLDRKSLLSEAEWDSACPAAADGKHIWCRETEMSDSIYQVFTCQACGQKLSMIL